MALYINIYKRSLNKQLFMDNQMYNQGFMKVGQRDSDIYTTSKRDPSVFVDGFIPYFINIL